MGLPGARTTVRDPFRVEPATSNFLKMVNEARPLPLLGFGINRARLIPFLSAT